MCLRSRLPLTVRVVSLTCSNTEIVAALGAGDQLVGVDDHSDYPEDLVASLPRVGPDLGIDVDAVARLRPDLVLASLTVPGHERVVDQLLAAGLPVLAPRPTRLTHVLDDVASLGAALGRRETAASLVTALEGGWRPSPPTGVRVLVEWWPKPVIVPGARSWVTDLLERAGGVNPFADVPRESVAVTDEQVVQADPDAIVIAWCGVPSHRYRPDVVTRRPGWQSLRAVREGRVFCVPEAYLGRPGPRLVAGYDALAAVVSAVGGGRDGPSVDRRGGRARGAGEQAPP